MLGKKMTWLIDEAMLKKEDIDLFKVDFEKD